MMLALYAHLRAVNVALACLILTVMACRAGAFARAAWPSKLGRLVVLGWVLVNGAGTAEALHQAASIGYRIPGVTTALLLTLYWLAADWAADRRTRALSAALAGLVARDSAPAGAAAT